MLLVASAIGDYFGLSVADPRPEGAKGRAPDGIIRAVNLLDADGIRKILSNVVTNFTSFAPLGTVLVALILPTLWALKRTGISWHSVPLW